MQITPFGVASPSGWRCRYRAVLTWKVPQDPHKPNTRTLQEGNEPSIGQQRNLGSDSAPHLYHGALQLRRPSSEIDHQVHGREAGE
jgi:hypothetical protein